MCMYREGISLQSYFFRPNISVATNLMNKIIYILNLQDHLIPNRAVEGFGSLANLGKFPFNVPDRFWGWSNELF